MASKSPSWLVTPCSPMSRPPPMYPDSGDDRMRELDKAAVDRLEPRSLNSPIPEICPRTTSLKPISEFVSASPLSYAHQRPPLSAPLLRLPGYRRPTIVEETRSMLLHHDAGLDRLAYPPPPHALGRRGSAPPGVLRARNVQLERQREHLRRRSLAGPYSSREPDLLVVPVELKRLSTIATHTADGDMPSPHPVDGRLTTRVVIHSRNRKPLVLTRTFDLNELRATIPQHVQSSSSPPPALPCSRRASMATLQVPTPLTGNRPRSPLSSALAMERCHSTAGTPVSDLHHPSPRVESRRRHHRPRFEAVPMRKIPYTLVIVPRCPLWSWLLNASLSLYFGGLTVKQILNMLASISPSSPPSSSPSSSDPETPSNSRSLIPDTGRTRSPTSTRDESKSPSRFARTSST